VGIVLAACSALGLAVALVMGRANRRKKAGVNASTGQVP